MANDGKFVLDGKRVEFSDYGGSSKDTSMSRLMSRLWHIEANVSNIEKDVEELDRACSDRLDKIDSEIRVMFKIVSENHLALMKVEKRIAVIQEKIDGID